MRNHVPLAAAAVNGAVVLLAPAGLVLLSSVLRTALPAHFTSGAVHAPAVSTVVNAIQASLIGLIVTMPLAGLAAWRTWVYAIGWLDQRRSWWRGVVEAAALGGLLVGGMLGSAALGAAARGAGSIWVIPAIALYASLGALRFSVRPSPSTAGSARRPWPVPGSMTRCARVVLGKACRHVCCDTRVVSRRDFVVLEHVNKPFEHGRPLSKPLAALNDTRS